LGISRLPLWFRPRVGKRYFSTNRIQPVKVYKNPDSQNKQIKNENRGKSGIYMWTNKINGKRYIGSSVNIPKRLSHSYTKKHMETKLKSSKSGIYSSRMKNGILNFKLEILEYCSPAKCTKIEQRYINLLKPEYNLLKIAGS
jgi:hypothetical protein